MILSVEINDKSINIVHAFTKKGGFPKFSFMCCDISYGVDNGYISDVDYVSDKIKEMLLSNCINTRKTVFVINSKSIIIRKLRLPALKKRNEIKSMIGYELSQLIPFKSRDYRIHYKAVADNTDEKYAWYIIYCIPEDMLESYRELCIKSGLKPAGFEIYCSCINKLYDEKLGTLHFSREDVDAFAYVCEEKVSFTVVNKGVCDFSRTAENYYYSEERTAAEETVYMGSSYMSGDGPLSGCLDEIIRCIRYYQSIDKEGKISRLYIFNSEISEIIPEFIDRMSREMPDVEIVTELPAFLQGIDKGCCYDNHCFMLVLAAIENGKSSYSLRKTEYNEMSDFRSIAAMAVIIVLSLFFIGIGVFSFRLYKDFEYMKAYISDDENIMLNNQIEELKKEIDNAEQSIAETYALKNKINEESNADSETLRCIFASVPENTKLRSVYAGSAGVTMDCTSDSFEEIACFLRNLRYTSIIEDIKVDEVTENVHSAGGYSYTLHCVLKDVQ